MSDTTLEQKPLSVHTLTEEIWTMTEYRQTDEDS